MKQPRLALSSTTIELLAVCSLVTIWTGCSYRTRLDIGQADIGEANSSTASETSALGVGCCEPTYVPAITVTPKTGECGSGTDLFDWRDEESCVSEEDVIAAGVESAFWKYFAGLDIAQNKTRSYARCNFIQHHQEHEECRGEGCTEPMCDRYNWAHKPMCKRSYITKKSCKAHWYILEYPREMNSNTRSENGRIPPPKALGYVRNLWGTYKANFYCVTPLEKQTDPANHWWLEYQFKTYKTNDRNIPWDCRA